MAANMIVKLTCTRQDISNQLATCRVLYISCCKVPYVIIGYSYLVKYNKLWFEAHLMVRILYNPIIMNQRQIANTIRNSKTIAAKSLTIQLPTVLF